MDEFIRAISTYLYRVGTYDRAIVVVELLLIALVVWWVIRFLRGTRGATLLKGAAVILVIVYLGIRLLPKERGWDRIEYLYGRFLLLFFLAFVVAFQPELRRALAQVGRRRLFGGQRRYVGEEIDGLVEAAAYLSRNRVGAIVAIERQTSLSELTASGTPLDAELTPALLNTLFYPGTQLHDMGVVIQNGRLAAAGCQFPLAESEDVDSSLGSRHRAALGLAKDTDAVVVVVSEQTGRISVACDGQLHVGLDVEALRQLLLGLLAPAPRGWLQRLLGHFARRSEVRP